MNAEIEDKKTYLLHWMYDFIEGEDEPAYLQEHIEECDQVLSSFIDAVADSNQHSDFLWVSAQVELLVKKLNELNFNLDHQLIETDQREDICALIELVLQKAGHECKGDMTEKWREW